MSETTLQALRGRINARLQTSAISRDRASAAGREVVALCRQSDVETLEWVLSEIDALLRTPRGEGETMDADEMWNHWTSGHEDAALLGLRTASEDEAHRFLSMLADWQRCPMPSGHDVAAALRSEAQGQGGIHPAPETWRCRQCGGYAAHYRDCPALRSEAQGEEDAVRRTWEIAVQRAYGCLDYCGGYRGAELEAFHSGIKTVIRALEAGPDTVDTQTAALDRIGAALRSEAQEEGWQVTEPARDIVRRDMPETRATAREAIRAARRGEGGGA